MKEILKKFNRTKNLKLISAIIIDLVGLASYAFPAIGEFGDLVWGPISGVLIYLLFPHRKKMAIFGAAEEMIPFIDFIPTACLAWMLDYVKDNKKILSEFVKKEVGDEQLVKEIMNTHNIGTGHFLE